MRISIFPLPGAILFPGLQLPLHIFEPRYRALVKDALARDRRIGMIQPQRSEEGAPLYAVGCLGKIGDVEALEDGKFNVVLHGEARFIHLSNRACMMMYRLVLDLPIVDDLINSELDKHPASHVVAEFREHLRRLC